MHAPPHRQAFTQRSLRWVLWLALLLPLAQVAANWHALSHMPVQADGLPGEGDKALHSGQCDYCTATAALAGGALPADGPVDRFPPRIDLPSLPGVLLAAGKTPGFGYRSRAPPFPRH